MAVKQGIDRQAPRPSSGAFGLGSQGGPRQQAARQSSPTRFSGGRAKGYTLVEVGLVIGLMGLLAVAVADHYLSQIKFERSDQRVEGAVSDVRSIIDAAILWRESHLPSLWPNEANAIDAGPLVDDGFLPFLPPNRYRYFECESGGGCSNYDLTGWDRGVVGGPPPGYTEDPLEAEDLVVQFNVWGLGEAKLVASQLPFGRVLDQEAGQLGSEAYTVETRVLSNALGGESVMLHRESRPVVFSAMVDGSTDELWPRGDLRHVARITGGAPPTGSPQAENPLEAVAPGIRLEPARATMNDQGSFGGKVHVDGPFVINVDQGAQFTIDDYPNLGDEHPVTAIRPYDGIVYVVRGPDGRNQAYFLGQQIANLQIAISLLEGRVGALESP